MSEEKLKRQNLLLHVENRELRMKGMAQPSVLELKDLGPSYDYSGSEVMNDADRSLGRMVRPRHKIQEEQHG